MHPSCKSSPKESDPVIFSRLLGTDSEVKKRERKESLDTDTPYGVFQVARRGGFQFAVYSYYF